ncbi:MAG: hypothetical protein SV760_02475, partial [Halobacteria archaeon]|nr:hypothetical protein [Halobacteria archaeon]
MSTGSSQRSQHLGNPVNSRGRVSLEEAINAYKTWSEGAEAYVESDDQSVTHQGFESLLAEVREDTEMEPVVLSRLVERFTSIDSRILDENEVRSLLKRYPQLAFEDRWDVVRTESVNDVDLLLKSDGGNSEEANVFLGTEDGGSRETEGEAEEGGKEGGTEEGNADDEGADGEDRIMLVEVAFSESRRALGTLVHERERLSEFADAVEASLVVLDADDHFERACEEC